MAKTNYLAELASENHTSEEMVELIAKRTGEDNDLLLFFMKTAIMKHLLFNGNQNVPSDDEVTHLVLSAIVVASKRIRHAATAYQQYLILGDAVIISGMLTSVMGLIDEVNEKTFKEHFGDIFKKAE